MEAFIFYHHPEDPDRYRAEYYEVSFLKDGVESERVAAEFGPAAFLSSAPSVASLKKHWEKKRGEIIASLQDSIRKSQEQIALLTKSSVK